ncbi:hypothetical protein U8C35_06440 [Sinorhizobium medicae]|uniref:hypothetical protein n=1 Tax=Sinorhizobium medicae TaxID=110321 RepID=UPI002AF6ABE9|nr:hypothetical protein [Sinorhizobium medicae]WQO60071.1 hypothetical protein U8C35_06440 [Sinorhizobium medicae]
MKRNERLAETLRKRQLYLLRHQVSVRNELDRFLSLLDKAIATSIITIAPSEPARQIYRQQRLDKMIEEVAALITATYSEMRSYHRREMQQLAEVEAAYLVGAANDLFESSLVTIALPAAAALELVDTALISGAPMKEWWAEQSASMRQKFAQQMRVGFIGGESDADLVKRIRGTRELQYADGLMSISRRMARILVRGAGSSVVGATRRKAVADNPDVFKGLQQISVLDGRTSHTCISYAGKVWSLPGYKPVGHSLPYNGGTPRHPNCRSTEIPVIVESLGGAPADDVDFETFLKGKSVQDVDSLLGKGRAELYRTKQITLSELVDQNGRPLTLEQLRNIR